MSDNSRIEWTEATWNPVVGCWPVSPGCGHCYAARMARRLAGIEATRATYGPVVGPKGWNGQVRLVPDALEQPLHWKKPRRIFVCSMSDLFHESVPFEYIDRVFAVMALCPQHTFQVLTKRPAQMEDYLAYAGKYDNLQEEVDRLTLRTTGRPFASRRIDEDYWPLPNVWLGVSAEDQTRLDERAPHLLNTPAAVRFLSLEPLLGPVDLTRVAFPGDDICMQGFYPANALERGLDWVIVGGESGPGAWPMHPDWVRSVRDQCVAAGVPFLFKQWGEGVPHQNWPAGTKPTVYEMGAFDETGRFHHGVWKGGLTNMARVGKKRAGRELDGCTWDEYPEGKP